VKPSLVLVTAQILLHQDSTETPYLIHSPTVTVTVAVAVQVSGKSKKKHSFTSHPKIIPCKKVNMKYNRIELYGNILWKCMDSIVNHSTLYVITYYMKTVAIDYTLLTFVHLCHNGMSHLKIFWGCNNKQLGLVSGHILISLTKA
jgi:hypothetical protein